MATVAINPPLFFSRLYETHWYAGMLHEWVGGMDLRAGSRILELGCGPGNLSAELAKAGHRVTGADKSERMIRRACKTDTQAKFVLADALHLPMADNAFDVVLLASLINLVPDRAALLDESRRVLKPGGVISVLFPTPDFTRAKANQIAKRQQFGAFSTAAINMWASAPRKLDAERVSNTFLLAGFERVETGAYLEGCVASVSGTKMPLHS